MGLNRVPASSLTPGDEIMTLSHERVVVTGSPIWKFNGGNPEIVVETDHGITSFPWRHLVTVFTKED